MNYFRTVITTFVTFLLLTISHSGSNEEQPLAVSEVDRPKDILNSYNEILKQNPNHVVTLVNRAIIKISTGDFRDALNDLNRAILLDENLKPKNLTKQFNKLIPMFKKLEQTYKLE